MTNKGEFPNYRIDEYGNVYSNKHWNWIKLSQKITKKGYASIVLRRNGESHDFRVHRLVMMNFGDSDDFTLQVNHKDGNKLNNHISNLEWTTSLENVHHAIRTGLWKPDMAKHVPRYGLDNPNGRHSDEKVNKILEEIFSGRYTTYEIARRNECTQSFVSGIKHGRVRKRELEEYKKTHKLGKSSTTIDNHYDNTEPVYVICDDV